MRAADLDPSSQARTLYVSRPVLNSEDIRAWARSQGFERTVDPNDLHVTLAFSKAPVVWETISREVTPLTSSGGHRLVQPLGDKGAVVLRFEDTDLASRWKTLCDAGCKWSHPSYKPHVTITYQGTGLDLGKVKPYSGPILLGAERFKEVTENWSETIQEVALTEWRRCA